MTTARSSRRVTRTGRSCGWKTAVEAFGVWREPFVELRIPLLFNLRRDPFEKAQHNSNTYNDWFLDRPFVIVPITEMAGKFLMTMKDYPPSATAGSFNLSKMQKQIEELSKAARNAALSQSTGPHPSKPGAAQQTSRTQPEDTHHENPPAIRHLVCHRACVRAGFHHNHRPRRRPACLVERRHGQTIHHRPSSRR